MIAEVEVYNILQNGVGLPDDLYSKPTAGQE